MWLRSKSKGFGFTLIEMLISLSMLFVIIGISTLGLNHFRSGQSFVIQHNRFLTEVAQAKETIRDDIRVALANNGYTATEGLGTPGTSTFYFGLGTSQSTASQFEFQIFKPLHQSLAVPVSINANQASLTTIHDLRNSTDPQENKLAEYWISALREAKFFTINNSRKAVLIEKGNTVESDEALIVEAAEEIPLSDGASDFVNSVNLIRTAERIQYTFSSADQTILRISEARSDQPESTVILEGIRSFEVGYTFRDYESSGIMIPQLPNQPLTADILPHSFQEAWNTPDSSGRTCLNEGQFDESKCVQSKHIDRVFVRIEIETDFLIESVPTEWSDYQDMSIRWNPSSAHGRAVAIIDFQAQPENYNQLSAGLLSSGSNISCAPTLENRCKASCSSTFSNPDRNAPDWIGYGRHIDHPSGASSYCTCWTNPSNPDEIFIGDWNRLPTITSWLNASLGDRDRLTACGREYGCHHPESHKLFEKNPAYRLACGCLRSSDSIQTDNYYVNRTSNNAPQFESNHGPELLGYTLNPTLSLSDPSLTTLNALNRSLRCVNYQICDAAMNAYFGAGTSNNLFIERCQCLTNDISANCDTQAINSNPNSITEECKAAQGEPISPSHINYTKVCNRDFRNGTGPMTCKNTWSPIAGPTAASTALPPFTGINISAWNQIPINSETPSFDASTQEGGVYHFLSTGSNAFSSKLGISRSVADACECLEKKIQGVFVSGTNQTSTYDSLTADELRSFAYQNLSTLDFRQPLLTQPASAPSSPQQDRTTFASHTDSQPPSYKAVSYCSVLGEPNAPCFSVWTIIPSAGSKSCGQYFCSQVTGSGPGCCTIPKPAANGVITDGLEAWSGFCHSSCQIFSSTQPAFNQDEVDTIRRWITGTATGQPLPITCGGTTAGESQQAF
jgi:hypothetical protein